MSIRSINNMTIEAFRESRRVIKPADLPVLPTELSAFVESGWDVNSVKNVSLFHQYTGGLLIAAMKAGLFAVYIDGLYCTAVNLSDMESALHRWLVALLKEPGQRSGGVVARAISESACSDLREVIGVIAETVEANEDLVRSDLVAILNTLRSVIDRTSTLASQAAYKAGRESVLTQLHNYLQDPTDPTI